MKINIDKVLVRKHEKTTIVLDTSQVYLITSLLRIRQVTQWLQQHNNRLCLVLTMVKCMLPLDGQRCIQTTVCFLHAQHFPGIHLTKLISIGKQVGSSTADTPDMISNYQMANCKIFRRVMEYIKRRQSS